MKKLTLSFLLIVLSTGLYSQNYMKNIAEKACECISELPDDEGLTTENFGLCIIQEASLYKDELLRDHNIDMLNIDVDGEKLGRMVAVEMLTTCPKQIKRIVAVSTEEEKEENDFFETKGEIKAINTDRFVNFSLIDKEGKTSKFFWLTFVKSEIDIQNEFDSLIGKIVKIEYSTVEIFDPRIKEYRNFNMIETLNISE